MLKLVFRAAFVVFGCLSIPSYRIESCTCFEEPSGIYVQPSNNSIGSPNTVILVAIAGDKVSAPSQIWSVYENSENIAFTVSDWTQQAMRFTQLKPVRALRIGASIEVNLNSREKLRQITRFSVRNLSAMPYDTYPSILSTEFTPSIHGISSTCEPESSVRIFLEDFPGTQRFWGVWLSKSEYNVDYKRKPDFLIPSSFADSVSPKITRFEIGHNRLCRVKASALPDYTGYLAIGLRPRMSDGQFGPEIATHTVIASAEKLHCLEEDSLQCQVFRGTLHKFNLRRFILYNRVPVIIILITASIATILLLIRRRQKAVEKT